MLTVQQLISNPVANGGGGGGAGGELMFFAMLLIVVLMLVEGSAGDRTLRRRPWHPLDPTAVDPPIRKPAKHRSSPIRSGLRVFVLAAIVLPIGFVMAPLAGQMLDALSPPFTFNHLAQGIELGYALDMLLIFVALLAACLLAPHCLRTIRRWARAVARRQLVDGCGGRPLLGLQNGGKRHSSGPPCR